MAIRSVARQSIVVVTVVLAACHQDTFSKDLPALAAVAAQTQKRVALASAGSAAVEAASPPVFATFEGPVGGLTAFAAISNLAVLGDKLVVADQLTDPHLSLLSWKDESVRRFLGRHGLGSQQLIDPICLQAAADVPPLAWVYDFTERRLILAQLNVREGQFIRESISVKTNHVGCALWANGRIIATVLDKSSPAIVVLDRNGNELEHIATPHADAGALVPSAIVMRPDQRRFAVAYRGANQLDLFHASGVRDTSIVIAPVRTAADARNPHASVIAVAASSNFVYALVGAKPTPATPLIGTDIFAIHWDGQLERVIRLNYPVHSIAVSDNDQDLFGAYFTSVGATPLIGHWRFDLGSTALSDASAFDAAADEKKACAAGNLRTCHELQAPDRSIKY